MEKFEPIKLSYKQDLVLKVLADEFAGSAFGPQLLADCENEDLKKELQELTSRALNAVVMKSLPQSRDAVSVTSCQRLGMRRVKALFLMGQTSDAGDSGDGVFNRMERAEIEELSGRYIAPDPLDLSRTRRMYVKDALLSATEEVYITYPSSGMNGSANTHGHVISELKRAFEGFTVEGGVREDGRAELPVLPLQGRKAG